MTTSRNWRHVVLTFGDDCHPSSNYLWKLLHAKFRRWKHLRSRHMWFIIQVFCTYSAKNIPHQFFCFSQTRDLGIARKPSQDAAPHSVHSEVARTLQQQTFISHHLNHPVWLNGIHWENLFWRVWSGQPLWTFRRLLGRNTFGCC